MSANYIVEHSLIPPHTEGKQNDLEQSVHCNSKEGAHRLYATACQRLLSPEQWHDLCGPLSAELKLVSGEGNDTSSRAQEGDYFKIDIPGPGTRAGNGYDWVKVEAIEHRPHASGDEELCGIRLRPCANPEGDIADTAHFFKGIATSTLIVHRHGNTITASYHGRNEVPNINTADAVDNVRNTVITSGAMAGLSELQWNTLIKAFLE